MIIAAMKSSLKATVLVLLTLSLGCLESTRPATHPALQNASLPRFLPVEDFFTNKSSNWAWRVSPDGKKLAWLSMEGGRFYTRFRTLGERNSQYILGGSSSYHWTTDSHRFVMTAGRGGKENSHVFLLDPDKPDDEPADLTPFKNDETRVYIAGFIESEPNVILVRHNDRNKEVFDLYRLDLDTRQTTLACLNSGNVRSWILDEKGVLRARILFQDGKESLELKAEDKEEWREVLSWRPDEEVDVLGFTADGQEMYLASNIGRDRIAVVRFDPRTGKQALLVEDPDVDLARVWISRVSHRPIVVFSDPGYPRTVFLDPSWQRDFAFLEQEAPVGWRIESADRQERLLVIGVTTDRSGRYELVNRDTGERTELGKHFWSNIQDTLAPVKPVSFKSRDGLTVHGYLTRPIGASGRLPTVLLVHGGPWARDSWTLDPEVQLLANRGYAVLQVNYRGSSGYGRSFLEAGAGELARKMHTDLLDGVDWAVQQGVTDPKKVAIIGGSYGGYAALVGLTFTPDVFACGVDFAGISDLPSFMRDVPKSWKLGLHQWHHFVGNPDDPKDVAEMKARSPLYKADQVTKPLLIAQGANDPRVQKDQANRMVQALRRAGKKVDYILLPDAGHGFSGYGQIVIFYHKVEVFLAKHLGGRAGTY